MVRGIAWRQSAMCGSKLAHIAAKSRCTPSPWIHPGANAAADPLYPSTPLPLYPSTPLPLYPSTPLSLYPSTPLPLSLTPLPLYPSTPLSLTPLPLYPSTPLPYGLVRDLNEKKPLTFSRSNCGNALSR